MMSSSGFKGAGEKEAITQALFAQLNAIVDEAGREDRIGTWGVDGWIRTIHDLIDLQVRTYAAIVKGAIAGPWFGESPFNDPLPSETFSAGSADCARSVEVSDFVRIGVKTARVPASCIGVLPPFLPADVDEFVLYLKDHRYTGANYRGTVTIRNLDGTPGEHAHEVTVGL